MRKATRITEAMLLEDLKAEISRDSLRATARRLGFTPQFLCDVIYERRAISERLAGAMGYRRVVIFERKKTGTVSANG